MSSSFKGLALECYICADCAEPFDRAAHQPEQCTLDNLWPETNQDGSTTMEPDSTTDPATEIPTTIPTTITTPEVTTQTPPQTTAPPITTSGPVISTTAGTTESTTVTIPPVTGPPQTTGAPTTTVQANIRERRSLRVNSEFRCFVTHIGSEYYGVRTQWQEGDI